MTGGGSRLPTRTKRKLRKINDNRLSGKIGKEVNRVGYQKISVELVVFSEEANAVAAELNSAIDLIEESHAIFGGEIETGPMEHCRARRTSALTHSLHAQNVATKAVKSAAQKVVNAYKKVI
jgi:aryl-alcohol dehydrogenase-like predicted oxidoreductase